MRDSELVARCASSDRRALEELYERHARSAYGYALLITRHAGDAARVLRTVFASIARAPERLGTGDPLRFQILALTRGAAYAEKSKRDRTRSLLPMSRALDPATRFEAQPESEEAYLLAVEGIVPEDLQRVDPPMTEPRASWAPPPPYLKALAMIDGADAMEPSRKFVRRIALWMVLAGSILVAWASDVTAPVLPPASSDSAPADRLSPAGERRALHDIIDGFQREGKR